MNTSYTRRRAKIARKICSGKSVFDVGFGNPDLPVTKAIRQAARTWTGHETDPKLALRPAEPWLTLPFESADISAVIALKLDATYSKRYDVVHLGEVIEHTPRPSDMIRNARALLKPGGCLLISTPNADYWRHGLACATGPIYAQLRKLHPHTDQHLAIHDTQTLSSLLNTNGLNMILLGRPWWEGLIVKAVK